MWWCSLTEAAPLTAHDTIVLPTAHAPGIVISREELGALPVRAFEGTVHLIDRDALIAPACQQLAKADVLGFDTETRPSFRAGESHPPALIQLADASDVFVFQIQKLRQVKPLLDLLGWANVTKAGVALADDLRKLREVHAFKPAGFTDIGVLARQQGLKQTGLRTLAGLLLGFRISKREQRSNWGRDTLTPSQLRYAATDAWVSRELYLRLTAG